MRLLLRAVLVAGIAAALAVALATGLAGGLLRAGAALPIDGTPFWLSPAVLNHAFLMVVVLLGTVIGIERAVALKRRFAFAVPVASGAAGVLMLAGMTAAASALAVLSALVFVAVNALLVRRQPAAHTALLLVAALCAAVGHGMFAGGAVAPFVLPWWFAFLVLTIVAERLEMTRLMRRRAGAPVTLAIAVALLLVGAAASAQAPLPGGLLYGLALAALAAWLVAFDIARRTVRAHGLSRYMAVALLLGHGWLGVAGAGWMMASLGASAWRDTALHALGLGFVFSMVFAHAPVILPALVRVKLLFGPWFYVPLALLHGSLALRLAGGALDPAWRAAGAQGNALAMALFVVVVAASAISWRMKYAASEKARFEEGPRANDALSRRPTSAAPGPAAPPCAARPRRPGASPRRRPGGPGTPVPGRSAPARPGAPARASPP
jgi:hypothetical protein